MASQVTPWYIWLFTALILAALPCLRAGEHCPGYTLGSLVFESYLQIFSMASSWRLKCRCGWIGGTLTHWWWPLLTLHDYLLLYSSNNSSLIDVMSVCNYYNCKCQCLHVIVMDDGDLLWIGGPMKLRHVTFLKGNICSRCSEWMDLLGQDQHQAYLFTNRAASGSYFMMWKCLVPVRIWRRNFSVTDVDGCPTPILTSSGLDCGP